MKVFKVRIKKGYGNDVVEKTVLASTIEKALDNAKRWAKKNLYSSSEITVVELIMTIDVVYKT